MPEIEKWIEEMKNKTLYEAKNESNLPMELLGESDTNSRYNEKMARLRASMENVFSTFDGECEGMFKEVFPKIVTVYRSLDGWSVEKAIEAQGVAVRLEEQENKKKGLFGLFGGGKEKE